MSDNTTWFVINTRCGLERKVSELLAKRRIECFYPLNKITNPEDKTKPISRPLFNSYIFIYIPESEYNSVKKINGVLNFLHWLDQPVRMQTEDVDMLKHFLHEHNNLQIERTKIDVLQRAAVVSEPLDFYNIEIWKNKIGIVKICLPMLGLVIISEVEKQKVKVINLSIAKNFFRFSKLSI